MGERLFVSHLKTHNLIIFSFPVKNSPTEDDPLLLLMMMIIELISPNPNALEKVFWFLMMLNR